MSMVIKARTKFMLMIIVAWLNQAIVTHAAAWVDVAVELERLAVEHDFRVVGLALLPSVQGHLGTGDLYQQLQLLLEDTNHIIVQRPDGGIERVIILGLRHVQKPASITAHRLTTQKTLPTSTLILNTKSIDSKFAISVGLEGINGQRFDALLLLDTGADVVVLPTTLMAKLGISTAQTTSSIIQTANGRLHAHCAVIAGLWLNDYRMSQVEVAFIDAQRLGSEIGLLGMNVLHHFNVLLKQRDQQVHLIPQ
jgi:clan AA aspartic protease (TIGR02281 family)